MLDIDSTLDERAAAPVSFESVSAWIDWLETNPPCHSPIEVGWDLRKQFREEGFGLFSELLLEHDPPARSEYIAEAWASFDRPEPTQFDRLLLDEMGWARRYGWTPPGELESIFAATETQEAERRAAEETAWQAAGDAEHAAWITSGKPYSQECLTQSKWNAMMDDMESEARARAEAIAQEVKRRTAMPANDFIRDARTGHPENNNPDNVAFLLRSLNLSVRFNSWLERVEIRGGGALVPALRWHEWTYVNDTIVAKLRTHAARTHTRFCAPKDFMWDSLIALAHANSVDPAVDLLAEMQAEWDGTPRLSNWLSETCGVPADAYHHAVSRNIIGGMVRRIRQPGCKHDEIAVLIGPQGTLKSTLISILAPRPEWYTESVRLGDEAKELVLSLAGKAVVEISEMGTRTRDVNAIKAMVSRTTDAGRTAYARSVTERPRRNIFVSSTNDESPLIDDTGNRRFLPVRVVGQIKTELFKENARQLIGEAAALESEGHEFAIPRHVWSEAAAVQETARAQAEYEVIFGEWFAEQDDLAVYVTAADLSELARAAAGRAVSATHYTKTMRALKFVKGSKRVGGKPAAVWHRGDLQRATRMAPTFERGRIVPRLAVQTEAPVLVPQATPAVLPPLPVPR